jgi:hypothetical protein
VLRPLGEIRDALEDIVQAAPLSDRERELMVARYGLSGFPTGADGGALARRLRPQRRHGDGGLRQRRLRDISRDAFAVLDASTPLTTDVSPVVAVPVEEPATADWFVARVAPAERLPTLLQAIMLARAYVGAFGQSATSDAVARELSMYHDAVVKQWPPTRPLGRSRARAVVALGLWETIRSPTRSSSFLAPAAMGVVAENVSMRIIDPALAPFLAGERDTAAIVAACSAALRLGSADQDLGRVLADILVGAFRDGLSREASGALLQTVVRIRSTDEDPSAVALALRAIETQPLHWRTLDAQQAAVKVATAFGGFALAEGLLRQMDSVLRGSFEIPAGREIEVERVETGLWGDHQWSATLRRMLDDGHGDPAVLERALEHSHSAITNFFSARELAHQGATGDFTQRWLFYLAVREAELRLAEARL